MVTLNQRWGAGPFRDGKAGTWEGAYRVPGIAWWPGRIKPRVSSEIASMPDLFNTSIGLAGAALPEGVPLDGVEMAPMLFDVGPSQREVQHYYYGDQLQALRKGAFKIHFVTNTGYGNPPYGDEPEARHDPLLLFNLNQDPGEQYNVAGEYLEVVAELTRLFQDHLAIVTPGKKQF